MRATLNPPYTFNETLRFVTLLLGLCPLVHAAESGRPNILILYADDWRHDVLGVAGHPVVKTPHIDRLAGEGTRFVSNCVTTSICGISRASLFTGQWMARHGARAFTPFKTPWVETYPGILRKNGYFVGHVGKWHNGAKASEKEFDFCRAYHGRHWYDLPDRRRVHVTKRNEEDSIDFLRTRPKEKPFALTVCSTTRS